MYTIEIWGKQADGLLFEDSIRSKSPKQKNWLPRLREKLGDKIDFDNLSEFNYRVVNTQEKVKEEQSKQLKEKIKEWQRKG